MTNLNPPDRSAGFRREDFDRELLAITADPKVRNLAARRAGDRDLAEDVVQEAWYIVNRMPHPERIADLRAYFCTVVIHQASRLRSAPGMSLYDDLEIALSVHHRLDPASRNLEEGAIAHLMAQARLARFTARKHVLRSIVPGRSPNPDRYRDLIIAAAEAIIAAAVALDHASDKDSRERLLAEYPEWFAEPGSTENTCDQRLSRARADLRALLQKVVPREELLP